MLPYHCKKDFADVVKVRILRQEIILGQLRALRRARERRERQGRAVMMEEGVIVMQCVALKMEKDNKPGNVDSLWVWKRGRSRNIALSPP